MGNIGSHVTLPRGGAKHQARLGRGRATLRIR